MIRAIHKHRLLGAFVGSVVAFTALAADTTSVGLRDLTEKSQLLIGAAFMTDQLQDPDFVSTLTENYNQFTPENEMKWGFIHPEQQIYDFVRADRLVAFAEQHDMTVKGHTLVWHIENPDWLTQKTWTKEALKAVLKDHIQTVVGHYKGRVAYWDVINEGIDDTGNYRETLWYKVLGEEYIALAFRWAHEADPKAKLFYNDYMTEGMLPKANAVYRMVKALKEQGVPIDGVGTQLHLEAVNPISEASIAKNVERLAELGLELHFTEIDSRIRGEASETALYEQAKQYRKLLELALYFPNIKMYTMWGMTDKYSWIPHFYKGQGHGLIFDKQYQPKPAYIAMHEILKGYEADQFTYTPPRLSDQTQRNVIPFIANPLQLSQANRWQDAVFYPFAFNQLSPRDQITPDNRTIKAKWALGYQGNTLYGRVYRQDNKTVTNNKEQIWENDNVEVFLNYDGERFFQLRTLVGENFAPSSFPGSINAVWSEDGGQLDFSIRFDDFVDLTGQTFAFNIALSDNNGQGRDSQLYPITGANTSWQGSDFAELFFTGMNAEIKPQPVAMPPAFKAVRLHKTPTSAEDFATAYRYSFAFNQLNPKDMTVDDQDVLSGQWRVAYYNNWIYGVVDRHDDITIVNNETQYLNDNVEVFINQGDVFAQLRTLVNQDFDNANYKKQSFAKWNEAGTQLFFGIEMPDTLTSGESIRWNIALADNDDGDNRRYQLYSVPGNNRSYLGEELATLTME